jgi:hypothetical protein
MEDRPNSEENAQSGKVTNSSRIGREEEEEGRGR